MKKKKKVVKFKDETESSDSEANKKPQRSKSEGILKETNHKDHVPIEKDESADASSDTHDSVSSINDDDVQSIMAACEVNH